MAGQTGNAKGTTSSTIDDKVERIRQLNEQVIEAAKTAGGSSLDAYEKALTNLLDFENKIAGGTQLEWISALAKSHTDFVSNISSAYTKVARDLLK